MEVFFCPKYYQVGVILFSHNLLTREQETPRFFGGGEGAETPHHRKVVDRTYGGTWRSADRCTPHDPTA